MCIRYIKKDHEKFDGIVSILCMLDTYINNYIFLIQKK